MEKNGFYEEFGRNYRFFLSWRYGVFGAYFVLIYGAFSLAQNTLKTDISISGIVLVVASLISLCLWIADCRTRDIYRNLTKRGQDLEKSLRKKDNSKAKGAYTALEEIGLKKLTLFSQSTSIDGLFAISFFAFLFVGFVLMSLNIRYDDTINLIDQISKGADDINLILGLMIPFICVLVLLLYRYKYFKRFIKKG